MKILHPTDFSVAAEKARLLACDLSRRLGAELTVVHVSNPIEAVSEHYFPAWLPKAERLNALIQKQLADARATEAKRLDDQLASLTPAGGKRLLLWGKAVPKLLEILPAYTMVVMGAHGDNPLDSYFLGGVAGQLVRRSSMPVLTVRETCAVNGVERVLLATDFSTAAEHAWRFCLQLADAGIKLAVAHVLEGHVNPERVQQAAARLEELSGGVRVRHVIREGDPVGVLPQLATELAADAITLGVAQQVGALGLRFGSRADALLRSSSVPILSVPFLAR